MNDLYRQLFGVLIDQEWKHSISSGVEAALLGRFYERFADHAVEIGRRVIFMDTGVLPTEDEISTY
jgi:phosphate transport system protein